MPARRHVGNPRRSPRVRKGMPSAQITRDELAQRIRERFRDPAFADVQGEIDAIIERAWDGYREYRKSPLTRKAGPGFADPEFEVSLEWLAARAAIRTAEREQRDPASRSRILLINGAARSDKTCPGEMSKTWRLAQIARRVIEAGPFDCEVLDLSRLTSEYGRQILPCKACVSTAMPLCHWPCSCYPNFAMGQTNDWMNEIYPLWARAHGVMIVTPVYWYQAPSVLKLMIDRLVCADGGNPDPTSTSGKDPRKAKALEMEGWDYPRHLAGRQFAVVVHGDAEGTDTLRRSLVDWLTDMALVPAGSAATIDRYIGYYEPYATSHNALDRDRALQEEVRNTARTLMRAVRAMRAGRKENDAGLSQPRPK